MVERFCAEVRLAVRRLTATPAITLTIVGGASLAIGINLAMLGLIDRALLSPPPLFPRAEKPQP